MIKKHYKFTEYDAALLKKAGPQKKTKLAEYNFTNTTVFKPWGFEYLFMENKNCCGWMLHITENLGTSLHCHKTKQTMLCVIEGFILLMTIRHKQILQHGDIILIDKKVFHSMAAIYGDAKIIELEMPSYKPDAIRAIDFWDRKGLPYESKCLLLELNPPKVKRQKEVRKRGKT